MRAAAEALARRRRKEGARGAGGGAVGKPGSGNLDGATGVAPAPDMGARRLSRMRREWMQRSRDFLWCKSRAGAIALPATPASYFLRPKRSTTSPTTSAACSLSAARRSASGASGAGAGDSARAAEAGENSLWEAQRPSSPISTEQAGRIIDPSEGKDRAER